MKKAILILTLLLMPINIYGKEVIIDDHIISAEIDVAGNLLVKEVIKIEKEFTKNINYNKKEIKFKGKLEEFIKSDFYKGNNVEINKVGIIDYEETLSYNVFEKEIKEIKTCEENDKTCYTITEKEENKEINIITEKEAYIYIEYLIGNIVVIHNDTAELYYDFTNNENYETKNYQMRILLPMETTKEIKVWGHTSKHKEHYIITNKKDEIIYYYGDYISFKNLPKNTTLEIRMTFPKELIGVTHPFLKKTDITALDKIKEAENKISEELKKNNNITLILIIVAITSLLISITLFTKIIKRKKEK